MIVFYNTKSGQPIGSIGGRVHTKEELNMWIGDKKETDRIIIQWKPNGKEKIHIVEENVYTDVIDEEGFTERRAIGKKKRKTKIKEFEPDHPQKDIVKKLETHQLKLYDLKIDLKTKLFIPIKE